MSRASPSSGRRSEGPGGDGSGATSSWWARPRACGSCGQSKVKCIWPSGPGVTPCHRCAKGGYRCTLPEPNPRKKRGPSTRVGQLEERIDGIMSLLTASQQLHQSSPQPAPSPPSTTPTAHAIHTSLPGVASYPTPNQPSPPYAETILPPIFGSGSPTLGSHPSLAQILIPQTPYIEIIPGFRVSTEEAGLALQSYREVYAPNFPFVQIPDGVDVIRFSEKQPVLFKSIIGAVVPQSLRIQRDMESWFRETIARDMIVKTERRLELLQAILVYLAWGYHHFYLESKVTTIIELAHSLVIDLGLSRSPAALRSHPYSIVNEASVALKGLKINNYHTLDDKRAMLGCFCYCAVVASIFRRMHHFPFTAYLDECCDDLLKASEYDSDKSLVALVRMHRLSARMSVLFPTPEVDYGSPDLYYGPLHMTILTMRKELDALMESIPQNTRNDLMWTTYYGICARLYEPVMYMKPPVSTNDANDSTRRTEALWNCLQSVKDFFSMYLTLPLETLCTRPFVKIAYFAFAIVTATRLLFLDDPDWDLALARRSLDLAGYCGRLAERFDEAERLDQSVPPSTRPSPPASNGNGTGTAGGGNSSATGQPHRRMGLKKVYVDENRSITANYGDKARWIRGWYLNKLHPDQQPRPLSLNKLHPDQQPSHVGCNPSSSVRTPDAGGNTAMGTNIPGVATLGPVPTCGGGMMDMNQFGGQELDASFWQALMSVDDIWGSREPI